MPDFRFVTLAVADGIGTLTLNRPDRLNAFDGEMRQELAPAVRELAQDPRVRVLVVTGAGRAFCAGADVKYMQDMLGEGNEAAAMGLVESGSELVALLRATPKPVLASINGPAVGGGANLALACDLRIASDRATLGQVFGRIGLHPDMGGTWFLPRLVGPSRALDLIWSAEILPADRCLALGLVDRLVPHDRLAEETAAWARQLAAAPPLAAAMAKERVYAAERGDLGAALAAEIEAQRRCFRSADVREGLAAFAARREPHFQGS